MRGEQRLGQPETVSGRIQPPTEPFVHPPSPLSSSPLRLFVIFTLLIVADLSWRKGVYYSGGADMVVLGKGVLTLFALVLAATAARPDGSWSRIGVAPVIWLAGYLLVASVGALMHDSESMASLVLVARLALLAGVLTFAARSYSVGDLLNAMTCALLVVGLVSAVTGVGTLAVDGRLGGGLPPIDPNSVAMLVSIPFLTFLWRCVNQLAGWLDVTMLVVLTAVVWATGSRTGLASLAVASAVIVCRSRRMTIPVLVSMLLTVPVGLYVACWTPLLSGFFGRGDSENVGTLSSRTVAWTSGLDYAKTVTEWLFGAGLAVKQIPVSELYRAVQILDSTWISALIQVGIVGTVVAGCFVLVTLRTAWTTARPIGLLLTGFILFLAQVSLLESGLFDSSAHFVVFYTLALVLTMQRSPVQSSYPLAAMPKQVVNPSPVEEHRLEAGVGAGPSPVRPQLPLT